MSTIAHATLFVVRHCESEWNVAGRQQGQLDSPLTARGREWTEHMANYLRADGIDAIFSSDLGRCMESASYYADSLGLGIQPDSGLRERHLGILQGLTLSEFAARHAKAAAIHSAGDPDVPLPGGESARQFYRRSVEACERIARQNGGRRLLLVTHSGVLESLIRHTLGVAPGKPPCFTLAEGAINRFTVCTGEWRLDVWGDIPPALRTAADLVQQ